MFSTKEMIAINTALLKNKMDMERLKELDAAAKYENARRLEKNGDLISRAALLAELHKELIDQADVSYRRVKELVMEAPGAALSEIEKCEPVYQYREIGEGNWIDCKKEWFDYCSKQPEMDTRILFTSPQPRDWVGLSLLRIGEIYSECNGSARKIYAVINDELKQLKTKG